MNILDFYEILLKRKMIFFIICIPAFMMSVVVCLNMTKIYRANAVISYATSNKNSRIGDFSSFLNISSPLGISFSRGEEEVIALLESKSVAEEVIKNKNLLPIFFKDKSFLLSFIEKIFPSFIEKKPPSIWDGLRYIENRLKVTPNKLKNTIEISFEFEDPEMTVEIVNEFIEVLNKRLKSDTINAAQNVIKALEKELIDVDDIYLKEKIYQIIASQLQEITFAESQKYLKFNLIDPPRVPDKKIKPKRRLIVLTTLFGAIFISVFLIILFEHIERLKANRKPDVSL